MERAPLHNTMDQSDTLPESKVPQVTRAFWIVKIFATAGETGGDAVSLTLKLGYVVSTMIFLAFRGGISKAVIFWAATLLSR